LGRANKGEKLGLVWRNRKKISQIINDYLLEAEKVQYIQRRNTIFLETMLPGFIVPGNNRSGINQSVFAIL
jgi:hypothetical protein